MSAANFDERYALLHSSVFFGAYDSPQSLWKDEIQSGSVSLITAPLELTEITYTFLQFLPTYYTNEPEARPNAFTPLGDSGVGDNQAQAVKLLLSQTQETGYETYFADVANIFFSEVSQTDSEGNASVDSVGAITLARYNDDILIERDNASGYNAGLPWQDSLKNQQGDIWLNDVQIIGSPAPGSVGFSVIMHEIGHALGLEHPFLSGDFPHNLFGGESLPHLPSDQQTWQYSVMVKNELENQHLGVYSEDGRNVYGLQIYDVAALQEIYGRNYTTRVSDTTYDLGHGLGGKSDAIESTPFIYTIWDGGGNDIIDASGYHNFATIIDLRQGAFSSVGDNGMGSGRASENLAIAFHAVIEDARGTDVILDSQGRTGDILVGNAWDNDLFGGAGNDIIFGDGNIVTNDVMAMGVVRGAGFHVGDSNRPGPESDPNNSGNDNIFGGSGADRMYGGRGLDYLNGGTENDQYFFDFSREQQFSSGTISFTIQTDGYDLIDETTGGGGFDTIKLENVSLGELHFAVLDGDLVIFTSTTSSFLGNVVQFGGGIIIKNGASGSPIEQLQFDRFNLPRSYFDPTDPLHPSPALPGFDPEDPLLINFEILSPSQAEFFRDIRASLLNGSPVNADELGENLTGSESDDILTGSSFNDDLSLGGGNDTSSGGDGHDQIRGGSGSDLLYGGSGNDSLDGGQGADTLYGGEQDDEIYGGSDNDTLNGDAGNDLILGEEGGDLILGGTNNDTIYGDDLSRDNISGADTIFGEGGNDTIYGGLGDDFIFGHDFGGNIFQSGDDVLYGDDGNDTIVKLHCFIHGRLRAYMKKEKINSRNLFR